MTTTTAARRPLVGWLIAIAGLAALLAVVLVLIAPSVHLTWLGLVADIALTIAFLFMAIGKGAKILVRIAYAVGAVGWAVLAIGSLVSLGTVLQIGIVLALVGTLVAGIAGMLRHVYSRAANLWFLLASIVVAVVLFNLLHGFLTGTFGLVVSGLYGLLLLVAGVLIALRR